MNKKFFSIIIPVYNSEKFLEYCLQSILNQDFSAYEIILVDDGSTDNSGTICDHYREKYPDLFNVVHQENQGQISARNAGAKSAKGEYIFFVDSDDAIAEGGLKDLYAIIKEHNADMVILNWRYMRADNSIKKDNIKEPFREGIVTRDELFKEVICSDVLNPLWLKICKCNLFEIQDENHIQVRHGEDLLQSLPAMANAHKIYYTSKVIYYYRVNENSVVHRADPDRYRSLFVVRPTLYRYLCNLGYDTDENIKSFYQFYLLNIWKNLFYLLDNKWKFKVISQKFQLIYDNEWVRKAEEYVQSLCIPWYKKLSLRFFYEQKLWMLYLSLKIEKAYFCIKDAIYIFLYENNH